LQGNLPLDLFGNHVLRLLIENWRSASRNLGSLNLSIYLRLIGRRQRGRNHIVGQPERGAGIHGIGREVTPVVSIPGISSPAPRIHDRRRPRVIRPPVVSWSVIISWGIYVHVVATGTAVIVPAIVAVIDSSVVVISPTIVFATVVPITALNISAPASFGDNARPIGTLNGDTPVSVQSMMNIH